MRITSGPIWSYIRDLPPELSFELDRSLSVASKAAWFNPRLRAAVRSGAWDGRTHMFNRMNGKLPTGLLPKAMEILSFDPEMDTLEDNRFPKDFSFLEAVERAKALRLDGVILSGFQTEAIINAVKAGRAILKLATNSGKSEIAMALAESIQRPALWYVNRKDLIYQCQERYFKRTGKTAGIIGDGEFQPSDGVTIASVQTLSTDRPEIKEYLSKVQVLLVDECQHAQAPTWYKLCQTIPAPFRFGLSGTLPSEELKRLRVEAATSSEIVKEVTNQELIATGWSAAPTVHIQPVQYHGVELMDYQEAYDAMIRSSKPYHRIVLDEIEHWYKQGKTILVIIDRIKQGAYLSSELAGRDIKAKFLSGQNKGRIRKDALDDFRAERLKVVIATSIFDEGVDVPAIEVLILAAGGKSWERQLQRVGRALRRKEGENVVDIVDFLHDGNRYLSKHSAGRLELYEKEAFTLQVRPGKVAE